MFYPSTSVGLRYGRPSIDATRFFSAVRLSHFRHKATLSRLGSARGFSNAPQRLHAWHLHDRSQADLPLRVTPSLHLGGAGILTGCPSPTPLGLG